MAKNKKSNKLSFDERYLLGYMKGMRIGRLNASRGCLIRCLHMKSEGKNALPSKMLIKKINREIDIDFLTELMFHILKETLSLEELEICYDRIFMVPDGEGKKLEIIEIQNKNRE